MSETGSPKLTTNFLQTLRYIWTSAKCRYDAAEVVCLQSSPRQGDSNTITEQTQPVSKRD